MPPQINGGQPSAPLLARSFVDCHLLRARARFLFRIPQAFVNGSGRPSFWHSLRRVFTSTGPVNPEEAPHNAGFVATLCVLGAVLIWFLLTMSERHIAEIEMPTEVVSLPPGQALVAPPPPTVRVEVEGEGFELLQLFFDRPTISIPATSSNQVDLYDVIPRLPGGVNRRNVTPRTLSLQTDERITRRMPVLVRVRLRMPPTFGLSGNLRVVPDSVTVTGAARIVNALEAWPTERRVFENVRDTFQTEVALSDTLDGFVTVSDAGVRVEAPVAEFTGGEREIDVRLRGAPSSERLVALDPSTVRVSFRVLLDQYREAMNAADFYATVSYDEIRQGNTVWLRPVVNLPEGLVIRDYEITPPQVSYYTVLSDD